MQSHEIELPKDIRDKTICMMRVKNEGRWIRRSLERTFQVCFQVVIFDDGSSDNTEAECYSALGYDLPEETRNIEVSYSLSRKNKLHFIKSPFCSGVQPYNRTSEIRDKNMLWWYCQANLQWDYMLCLDGDEWLSLDLIRNWKKAINMLDYSIDMLSLPFVYLWDSEDVQRMDGIYVPDAGPGKRLAFPRLFTWKRVSDQNRFNMMFKWSGTRGGFHCGSVPREGFMVQEGISEKIPEVQRFNHLIVHAGYLNEELRQSKYEFYNRVDPDNEFEGKYLHIIGEKDRWAPGDLQFAPWKDV